MTTKWLQWETLLQNNYIQLEKQFQIKINQHIKLFKQTEITMKSWKSAAS
jgi:hypothetical protein